MIWKSASIRRMGPSPTMRPAARRISASTGGSSSEFFSREATASAIPNAARDLPELMAHFPHKGGISKSTMIAGHHHDLQAGLGPRFQPQPVSRSSARTTLLRNRAREEE